MALRQCFRYRGCLQSLLSSEAKQRQMRISTSIHASSLLGKNSHKRTGIFATKWCRSLVSFSTTAGDDDGNDTIPTYNIAQVLADGNVEMRSLQAAEILRGTSIQARDLYSLARTHLAGKVRGTRRPISLLLPRGRQMILSFGTIRAVVSTESAMLFDAHLIAVDQFARDVANGFATKTTIKHCLDGKKGQPFELVFLEEVLRSTCDAYNRRILLYEPIVDSMLNRVTDEVFSSSGVHQLVPVKNSLQAFEMRVQQGLDCLTELLDSDDDMLGLLLSEQIAAKEQGEQVARERHGEVELLLEDYARQLNNILFEIKHILQRLQSKQEFVAIALDGYRNRLIRMNSYMAMFGLGIGCGTTVAGFFGMNVITGYEDSTMAFNSIILGSSLSLVLIVAGCTSYISGKTMKLRAVERLEHIETLSGALSDMNALDYTVKKMTKGGAPMTKAEFKECLSKARDSKKVTDKEIDLLFHSLDTSGNGLLYSEDCLAFEKLVKSRSKN